MKAAAKPDVLDAVELPYGGGTVVQSGRGRVMAEVRSRSRSPSRTVVGAAMPNQRKGQHRIVQ